MAEHVWIIIVNYRTADLATACLQSISEQLEEVPRLSTVVVDNDSGDGSVEKLREAIDREGWQRWAVVLPQSRNGGFAFGNNAGIQHGFTSGLSADYVILLNPDAVVQPGAIRALVDFMDSNKDVGIAGSRLEDAHGMVQCSAHNAPSPLGELESGARLGALSRLLHRYAVSLPSRDNAHECEWVSGASLIIRRQVFDDIGLMDDKYFLYFEEVDFCFRARKADWKIWFVPQSRVVHIEGASTGIKKLIDRRPRYWYDSRRRYFVKHYGLFGLILADALWFLGRVTLALRRKLRLGRGGDVGEPQRFAFDLLWGDLRALLTGSVWKMWREQR